MENTIYDTIIVGGGISAFASAMYAGRLKLKTLVIGEEIGGKMNLIEVIENYPGFKSISGKQLFKSIEEHAKSYGIDIINIRADRIEKDKNLFIVYAGQKQYKTKTVIIATGTKVKNLNVPGEEKFRNKGVSYCALCDGPLFRDKVIAVVGGGDSAAKEALFLTNWAKKVFIINRSEKIHPEPITMEKIEKKIKEGKIEIINNTNVVEIKGNKFVTGIILDKPYNGNKELKVDGLFIYIGNIPISELVKDLGVAVNEKGEIIVNKNSETNIPGIFAAGDVTDIEFKQAITGVAQGVTAAYYAYRYISKMKN